MLGRLFAVIVHAGKNSHSGHYIAYVRNVAKNEWWKMDDARVTLASFQEVMSAEAYMLFYRVVDHPLATKLRDQAKKLQDEHQNDAKQHNLQEEAKASSATQATAMETEDVVKHTISSVPGNQESVPTLACDTAAIKNNTSSQRKRKAPDYSRGEDWARAKTNIPEHVIRKFADIQQIVSEYVHFKSDFFTLITEQANKGNAKVGHGPSTGVCGKCQDIGRGIIILQLFFLTGFLTPCLFVKPNRGRRRRIR